jgi:hypothetical protein
MVNFIELEGLDDEDILLLETIAERLRKRAKSKRVRKKRTVGNMPISEDVLEATAGAWEDSLDCEDLKRRIYENRLISSRPEVRL